MGLGVADRSQGLFHNAAVVFGDGLQVNLVVADVVGLVCVFSVVGVFSFSYVSVSGLDYLVEVSPPTKKVPNNWTR